jgi:AraC-like DNA-binding protein
MSPGVLGAVSQTIPDQLDPASHGEHVATARFIEFRTTNVRPAERLAFWRDTVLQCMEPLPGPADGPAFAGRVRRIVTPAAELVEHAAEAIAATRSAERCRRDGHDGICIDAMASCSTAWMDQQGERRIGRGTLSVLDFGRPLSVARSRHRATGVILSRQRVREVLTAVELDQIAGRCIGPSGIGTLLQSHLRVTLDEVPRLSLRERGVAVAAAAEMALAVLQAEFRNVVDPEQFKDGFYHAARRVIERDCVDPELTPDIVARRVGCSRASLYRIFARRGESIAAVIWATRLEQARRMLVSDSHRPMSVSDIAFRAGFLEQPSFSRMFKRRFGVTPRDARTAEWALT